MKEVSGILQTKGNSRKVWDCVTDSVKIIRSSLQVLFQTHFEIVLKINVISKFVNFALILKETNDASIILP